jgi:uncharacterized protein
MAEPRALSRWAGGLAVLAALCAAAPGSAAPVRTIADTSKHVIDPDHVLDDAARATLEQALRELQDKTTAQVKILCVKSIGDDEFFSFVQRHFDLWKLGTKEVRNGAIIALAVDEHKVRIHTGYDLEGTLTDSWCGSLCREAASEFFKSGDYAGGLKKITAAVANQIADEKGVQLTGIPNVRHVAQEHGGDQPGAAGALVAFFLVILILILFGNRSLGQALGMAIWNSGSIGFGGGSSNGSFGGGSFGGGSSDGGSFGGGGSSGGGGGGASW